VTLFYWSKKKQFLPNLGKPIGNRLGKPYPTIGRTGTVGELALSELALGKKS